MSEYQVLENKIDDLKELFNERFDNNDREHKRINTHLATLNGQVIKNTNWRLKNSGFLKNLINDREYQFRKYVDFFWRILLVIGLIVFGLQNFNII